MLKYKGDKCISLRLAAYSDVFNFENSLTPTVASIKYLIRYIIYIMDLMIRLSWVSEIQRSVRW